MPVQHHIQFVFVHLFSSVVMVSFSPQNYSVLEGSADSELMIVLDKQSTKEITCNVTTMDITAECKRKVNDT